MLTTIPVHEGPHYFELLGFIQGLKLIGDGLMAALVARATTIPDLSRSIQTNDRGRREGWIALPFADSLDKLLHKA